MGDQIKSNSIVECDTIKEELGADGQPAGVEEEPYAPYPFDVEKISISEKKISLSNVVRRIQRGLITAADIQRRDNLWDLGKQSRLIESLMLRIPLPLFYAAADRDDSLTIVDGLQRTGTIKRFVAEKAFHLRQLEFLKAYEDMGYDSLPEEMKIRIDETELNFVIINPDSPAEVQRNIFKRLNTGGMPLTDQEIRHALYHGHSTDLLKRLVDSSEFAQATDNKVNDSRMAAQELALRYLAFSILGIENYRTDDTMDSYLSDTMQVINILRSRSSLVAENLDISLHTTDLKNIERRFFLAMKRARELFDDCAFRLTTPSSIKNGLRKFKTPINKSLFEVWSITLANMPDQEFSTIMDKRDALFRLLDIIFLDRDESFERRSIGRDSTKAASVKKRHDVIRNIISEITGAQ